MILMHNHRQGDAEAWIARLNRFRKGIVTNEDFEALKERVTDDPHLDLDSMHLGYLNQFVQDHNLEMLTHLRTPLITSQATKVYPKGRKPKVRPDGRIEDLQCLDVLRLKIGARCVLIHNINTVDDLVNGSAGSIIGVEYKKGVLDCIIVKFDKDSSGQQHRQKHPNVAAKYSKENGTPIYRHEFECILASRKGRSLGLGSMAKIFQFPMIINYASTAHKIQVM